MRVSQQERIDDVELDRCLDADLSCSEFGNVQCLTMIACREKQVSVWVF